MNNIIFNLYIFFKTEKSQSMVETQASEEVSINAKSDYFDTYSRDPHTRAGQLRLVAYHSQDRTRNPRSVPY